MIIWSSVERLPPRIPVVSPWLEVLIITHERGNITEMDDYFARKFFPLLPLLVLGRSYAIAPECDPRVTLYDAWKELVT